MHLTHHHLPTFCHAYAKDPNKILENIIQPTNQPTNQSKHASMSNKYVKQSPIKRISEQKINKPQNEYQNKEEK
jgi:hypothetical protein